MKMKDGNLPFAVLALIAARGEGIHGYRLKVEFDALYGDTFPMGYARLYRILSALEESGDLAMEQRVQGNRPSQKVYRITEMGLARLQQWLGTPLRDAPQPLGDEVSAKLLLLKPDDVDGIADIVRQHRHVCLGRLAHASRRQRLLNKAAIDDRIASFILDGAETRVRAELAWLERIERSVIKGSA